MYSAELFQEIKELAAGGRHASTPQKSIDGGNRDTQRHRRNPDQQSADESEDNRRNDKSENQHDGEKAEWARPHYKDALGAPRSVPVVTVKALICLPRRIPAAPASAVRRNDFRFCARAFRRICVIDHGALVRGCPLL